MKKDSNWIEAKEHLEEYAITQFNLLKINLVEKYSGIVSSILSSLMVWLVFITVILFLSIAAAFAIGSYLQQVYLGFVIVGGFYFILYILLALSRKGFLKRVIMNGIIKKIYEDE